MEEEELDLPSGRHQLTAAEEFDEVKEWAKRRRTKTLIRFLISSQKEIHRKVDACVACIEVLSERIV